MLCANTYFALTNQELQCDKIQPSPQLSQMLGMEIYFKKEYSLPTGRYSYNHSCKIIIIIILVAASTNTACIHAHMQLNGKEDIYTSFFYSHVGS